MVADIGDVQRSLPIEREAVWLPKLRVSCRPSIAAVAWAACSGNSGNDLRFGIDSPNGVILHFDYVHAPAVVETDLVRFIKLSVYCQVPIAGVPSASATRHRCK